MEDKAGGYARVKVEGEGDLVVVPVSFLKPEIPGQVQDKWQKVVDLVAGIMHVPSGLITRFTEENLEIFVASDTGGNPYKRNDRDRLGIGMFCESVAGRRLPLRVDDASSSEFWANNPHAGLGMKSYLGVPIQWEDGELFGTFCMLNDQANRLQPDFLDLMVQFKDIIETDLRYILLQAEMQTRFEGKELELREIKHRLKNQYNLLISFINLQSRSGPGSDAKAVLQEVQHRVMALAMVNEELHGPGQESSQTLDLYLRRLCDYILDDFAKIDIAIEYSIAKISLATDMEISLALIVTELLTNSIKYAFRKPGLGQKKVSLSIGREGDGALSMQYRDNGVGFPDGFDPKAAKTLGMILLGALVKQLNGVMKTENDGGAKTVFRFAI